MRPWWVTGLVVLAACGRVGFSDGPPAPGDGAPDAVPDAPACEQPARGDFAIWPMPNMSTGLPHPVKYTISAAGDVIDDQVTGLGWERASHPNMNQDEGKAFCESLVKDGVCDWRLPERIELISIADYTKLDPAIDAQAFPGTENDVYWSSTMVRNSTTTAWYVSFGNGNIGSTARSDSYNVRCVRGGGTMPSTHYDATADTVLDMQTGLTWQRVLEPQSHDHASALTYCAALTVAGGGWRVPSINELESLVDVSQQDPAINPLMFPDTPSSLHWSRDVQVADNSQGWTVDFGNGTVARSLQTALPVRCVR